jgi:undecaprenyl pyrophosphate synthase
MSAVQQQVAAGQRAPADVSMDTVQQHLYTKVPLHVNLSS